MELDLPFGIVEKRLIGLLSTTMASGEMKGACSAGEKRSKCAKLAPRTSLRIGVLISKALPAAGR